jgi:hypothetical protein
MADKKKAVLLRISPELWERLNRWAADELRSVNAQIEFVLREALRKHCGVGSSAEDLSSELQGGPQEQGRAAQRAGPGAASSGAEETARRPPDTRGQAEVIEPEP